MGELAEFVGSGTSGALGAGGSSFFIDTQVFEVYQRQGWKKVFWGELLLDVGFLELTEDWYYFLCYKPVQSSDVLLPVTLTVRSLSEALWLGHYAYEEWDVLNPGWRHREELVREETERALPRRSLFVDGVDFGAFLSMVYVYEPLYWGVRKERYDLVPDPIYVDQGDRKVFTFYFPHAVGVEVEQWGLLGEAGMFWWDDVGQNQLRFMANLDRVRPWTREGVQAMTPISFEPATPRGFWVAPDDPVGKRVLMEGEERFARNVAFLALDAALKRQHEEGIWPLMPRSDWLYDQYGMDVSFYDSRFNRDMALFLLQGYRRFGAEPFLDGALRYADFFCNHALRYHEITERGGFLVYDYLDLRSGSGREAAVGALLDASSGSSGAIQDPAEAPCASDSLRERPALRALSHVSLNHLLSEMNFLYEVYEVRPKALYLEVAEKIRLAVLDRAGAWIRDEGEGDLCYAWLPDGSYGLLDYALLTLSDMRYSQAIFERREGIVDEEFQVLIERQEVFLRERGLLYE
ncbi:hypothetical protein [Heliorestis convoluta]|uniref:Uncharacterized protein n=1 Tax=Heliorestis convoluta TaxID=356322 RepID=A0A5Q2MZ39_9FIRM|nr:hypothetical protein [Heliorestis convoluta]QGG47281.1 hypothetical protein FTV88_1134 [Heliorestis convoluta]